MAAYQRIAWLQLAICVAAITAVVFLGFRYGWSGSLGGAGLLGLTGLMPLLARPWGSKKVISDERDQAIQGRALRVAFVVVWVGLFLAAGLLMLLGNSVLPNASIPISSLPWFLVALTCVFLISHGIAVVVAYGGNP